MFYSTCRKSLVDMFDKSGETALVKGVKGDLAGVVGKLLCAGADLEMGCQGTGRTPLMHAAYLGRLQIATALLSAGADVHATDR